MGEPDTRHAPHTPLTGTAEIAAPVGVPEPRSVGIVGRGRVGTALARAFREAGLAVHGPVGRGEAPTGEAVLLCVPDAEIPAAAAVVAGARTARLVGHTSGASPLSLLEPARRRGTELFGLHPLQTFSGAVAPVLAGASCAVAGSTPAAAAAAAGLARRLGMEPFEIADAQRASYHAAASIASNFLVTLEATAESVAAGAGLAPERARAMLAPLVRQSVENWATHGSARALTGPVARGDEATVETQRTAVAAVDPRSLALFDALVDRTRSLAAARAPAGAGVRGVNIVRTVTALRAGLADAPRPVALVPTMGALHEGHRELVRQARARSATVVVSIFLNPTQFGPGEDLGAYPRDERRDAELAREAGADLVFAPGVEEVYPPGFDTTIEVGGLTGQLEDDRARRGPEHFRGVATVVAKLLNMVGPDVALFGQKDAQQALVIRKLVHDLDFPVSIEVLPTVRDDDGLALSSRNVYLSAAERERALALSRGLRAAEARVAAGELDGERLVPAARAELDAAGVQPDYLELRSAEDLSPAARVNGATLLCVAARVGRARLIDNVVLARGEDPPGTPPRKGRP